MAPTSIHDTPALDIAAIALRDEGQDSIEAALPILPKGIVENTAEVYAEVASFDVIPTEKLREYWRVYTVTYRKLYDPTANRLENFWWHVWGSKRRNLSGKTVARLYEHISTGETFVPLRTPARRYDGPTISYLQNTNAPAASTAQPSEPNNAAAKVNDEDAPVMADHAPLVTPEPVLKRASNEHQSTDNDDTDGSSDVEAQQDARVRLLSSSSSRPAPSQSILKKPRPSFSGPRPTPRFALPSGEPSENEGEAPEQSGESTAAEEDAAEDAAEEDTATCSVGSGTGSTDTNQSDQRQGKAAKTPSPGVKGKTAPAKRDGRLVKLKGAKKKFVVNSSASKRRTVVSKRSGSHGSQSSNTSEGPSSREAPSYVPTRHSEESLVGVEEEVEADDLPAARASPKNLDPVLSTTRLSKQRQAAQQTPAQPTVMTEKAAGKQPVRPPQSTRKEPVTSTSSSVLQSGAVSSVPKPLAADTTAPAPASSVGSTSGLEMPLASRHRQAATPRASLASVPAPIPRPGGGLIRQSTMPYEPGHSHRQQLGRIGSSTAMSSSRAAPTSAYAAGGAPGMSAPSMAAPPMGRSMSHDSYGVQPRLGYQSPILGPMRSATIAAPSMVAASGVFSDAEGPDPFELYARTGLDDALDDLDGEGLPPYVPESGSFSASLHNLSSFKNSSSFKSSSSFADSQSAPHPRPLFAPTRPAQTPRIPFARTRSQLNIILDREKERLGKGSYASWQESRGARDSQEHGDREHGEQHDSHGS